jgi:NAD+ diphosphatase
MLVEHEDRILMHRQKIWPQGMWSCLAGFVEPGETLEQAVVREVFEESGVKAYDVRYVASQPWPFPSSLMVAFTAKANDPTLRPDYNEIEDAQWFSRADLELFHDSNRQTGQGLFLAVPGSAARHMIEMWRERGRCA